MLSVEEKKAFWDSRINLAMVRNLFRPLEPVDVRAAWGNAMWKTHIICCIRGAVNSTYINRIKPRERPLAVEAQQRQVYADIRIILKTKCPDRPGLDCVPLKFSRSTAAFSDVGTSEQHLIR
jgi:hypothetical protein